MSTTPWDGRGQRLALLATALASIDAAPAHLRAPLIREARAILDALDASDGAGGSGPPPPPISHASETDRGPTLEELRNQFATGADGPCRHH